MAPFYTTISGAPTHFAKLLSIRAVSSNVISGADPTEVDPSNPITLFIIQLVIIIVFTQSLGWAFSYMKQPKVIAEIIGGIILGPTVFGRIPHFTEHIFPTASLSYLNLISTIGLVLFLFLVGVEVDIGVMKKHGKASGIISAAGMILPFGLGSAIAVPVYHNFVDTENVSFGHFLLFVGVAMAITAFPVLCRILTSTKLIDTRVGVMVLAAGVGNDVVGWVLLALTLALVNAQSGATAVYVLLCAVGWAVILLWPIRKLFFYLVKRTGSLEHGPTPGMMVLTLLIVFVSAFVTDIIGVHPIFGGFIAGLIIPHEGGFAIALVEKIDDLVTMLFLPIYFVLSGLQTNLGLLDTGHIWGYTILLCVVAFCGKFFGCAGAALTMKYPMRESIAIGLLMSCKGLVELIVLNVGLSAGIIDQRLFSMFVIEAVVLTFLTTPCTLAVYPERVRVRISDLRKGDQDVDSEKQVGGSNIAGASGGREHTSRFLVILQKLEHLSAVMLLTQMLEPPVPEAREPWDAAEHSAKEGRKGKKSISDDESINSHSNTGTTLHHSHHHNDSKHNILHRVGHVTHPSGDLPRLDALKLVELTGRTFSVMQSAEKDQLLHSDNALQLYRQFGRLRGLEISPHISIVGQDSFSQAVADYATDLGSELVILPWTVPTQGGNPELIDPSVGSSSSSTVSQFDTIFGSESAGSPMYSHFVRRVFSECPSDVALFVDRGFGGASSFKPGSGQHIFMPFFGGPDDRLALRFVVQLCGHAGVTATIVRVQKEEGDGEDEEASREGDKSNVALHQAALQSNQLTVGGATQYPETQARLQSDTADSLAWSYFSSPSVSPSRPLHLETALSRISFHSTTTHQPLTYAFTCAESAMRATSAHAKTWRPMLIVAGRGRRGAAINHETELNRVLAAKSLNPSIGAELRKTVGDVAAGLILGGSAPGTASYLIMGAGKR
ncbi:potassium:hydrogen antiporter [Cryptococcus neoformans]|nr:hypothetical protein AYX15_02640 [Cryptococcus neoformans var. grubii]OWZ74314.1 hypothetical protein AYX14_00254 [Cryptococcus neoformans var. grubii]OXG22672.1 potassium:hydrogen antiporter [Cryptococcus neoformans var. grubii Ze90-1]OXH30196.1 potassium:hydrogen antiporter [Cryptococcus neoformans var. grubii]